MLCIFNENCFIHKRCYTWQKIVSLRDFVFQIQLRKIPLDRLLRLKEVDAPWISRQPGQLAQEGGKVVSPMHWPPLAPRT